MRNRFRLFMAHAYAVAGALTALGIAIEFGAAALHPSLLKTFLENVGAVVFTIGVLSLLSEAFLRRDLLAEVLGVVRGEAQEILQAVGLNTRLAAAGITDIGRHEPNWDEFLEGAGEIWLLPADPTRFLDREWAAALEAARQRPTHIDVLIPAAEAVAVESLALRLLVEADQLRAELTPLPLRLADAFTASGAHSGSRLRVLTYDGVPGFGLARADERRAVVVPRITGPQPEARPLALVFHSGTDEAFSRWFDDSVDAINGELFDQRDIP